MIMPPFMFYNLIGRTVYISRTEVVRLEKKYNVVVVDDQ